METMVKLNIFFMSCIRVEALTEAVRVPKFLRNARDGDTKTTLDFSLPYQGGIKACIGLSWLSWRE